jgi:hypothetical protein
MMSKMITENEKYWYPLISRDNFESVYFGIHSELVESLFFVDTINIF